MTVRSPKGQTTHRPPPENQVPRPVSCSKGQTTLDLPGNGVAEYIVLAEVIAQDEIDPAGPEDAHSTVPLATETREPKRRKLIHNASRLVAGRAAADQELIVSLSNELSSAMRQLQESNVALDNCQQSKAEISRMQASSRARRSGYIQQQQERIAEQKRILQETTDRLEEREKMVHDLSELNEINRLLITRNQEHEDLEADLDDEENSRSSNWSMR